jgi:hypothetical protein
MAVSAPSLRPERVPVDMAPLRHLSRRKVDEGRVYEHGQRPSDTEVYFLEVSPGFIDTMRIRLLAGRDLVRGDFAPGSASVLVNETLARLFLPGPSPLGRKFTRPERASRDSPEEEVPHEVVRGVVAGIVGYVALGTVAGLAAGLWLSRFVTGCFTRATRATRARSCCPWGCCSWSRPSRRSCPRAAPRQWIRWGRAARRVTMPPFEPDSSASVVGGRVCAPPPPSTDRTASGSGRRARVDRYRPFP